MFLLLILFGVLAFGLALATYVEYEQHYPPPTPPSVVVAPRLPADGTIKPSPGRPEMAPLPDSAAPQTPSEQNKSDAEAD